MFRQVLAMASAFALVAGAASAQTRDKIDEASLRRLILAESGAVDSVAAKSDRIELLVTFDEWLVVLVSGEDCEGQGAARLCERISLNALFEVDDEARSRRLAERLHYVYAADMADGGDFILHREVELRGGVNDATIRAQIDGFIAMCEVASQEIWPETEATSPAAPAKPKRQPPA